jgi:hypothetical protein
MQIGVNQLFKLVTRGAHAARIVLAPVLARDVLSISYGKHQLPCTFWPGEQLGVGNPVVANTSDELVFHFALTDNIFE